MVSVFIITQTEPKKRKRKFDKSNFLDKNKNKSYDNGKGGENGGKARILFVPYQKILPYGFD